MKKSGIRNMKKNSNNNNNNNNHHPSSTTTTTTNHTHSKYNVPIKKNSKNEIVVVDFVDPSYNMNHNIGSYSSSGIVDFSFDEQVMSDDPIPVDNHNHNHNNTLFQIDKRSTSEKYSSITNRTKSLSSSLSNNNNLESGTGTATNNNSNKHNNNNNIFKEYRMTKKTSAKNNTTLLSSTKNSTSSTSHTNNTPPRPKYTKSHSMIEDRMMPSMTFSKEGDEDDDNYHHSDEPSIKKSNKQRETTATATTTRTTTSTTTQNTSNYLNRLQQKHQSQSQHPQQQQQQRDKVKRYQQQNMIMTTPTRPRRKPMDVDTTTTTTDHYPEETVLSSSSDMAVEQQQQQMELTTSVESFSTPVNLNSSTSRQIPLSPFSSIFHSGTGTSPTTRKQQLQQHNNNNNNNNHHEQQNRKFSFMDHDLSLSGCLKVSVVVIVNKPPDHHHHVTKTNHSSSGGLKDNMNITTTATTGGATTMKSSSDKFNHNNNHDDDDLRLCILPNMTDEQRILSQIIETRNDNKSIADNNNSQGGKKLRSTTRSVENQFVLLLSCPPTRDLIAINPEAFGKHIPSQITIETARYVSQVSNIRSEDWTRNFRFNQVIWPGGGNQQQQKQKPISLSSSTQTTTTTTTNLLKTKEGYDNEYMLESLEKLVTAMVNDVVSDHMGLHHVSNINNNNRMGNGKNNNVQQQLGSSSSSNHHRIVIGFGETKERMETLFGNVTSESVARVMSQPTDHMTNYDRLLRYGMIGLSLHQILENISADYECVLSILEVGGGSENEPNLYDLLAIKPFAISSSSSAKRLRITYANADSHDQQHHHHHQQQHHGSNSNLTTTGPVVTGLSETRMDSLKTLGHSVRRAFAAAYHRKRKSVRGHIVATLKIQSKSIPDMDHDPDTLDDHDVILDSRSFTVCQFVDIAPIQDSSTADRYRHNSSVRKSLWALGGVLRGTLLREAGNETGMIAYRESALTKVLQRSMITENSKTIVLASISPLSSKYEQTMDTLRYVNRLLYTSDQALPQSPFEPSIHVSISPTSHASCHTGADESVLSTSMDRFMDDKLLRNLVADPRQRLARVLKMSPNRKLFDVHQHVGMEPDGYVPTTYSGPDLESFYHYDQMQKQKLYKLRQLAEVKKYRKKSIIVVKQQQQHNAEENLPEVDEESCNSSSASSSIESCVVDDDNDVDDGPPTPTVRNGSIENHIENITPLKVNTTTIGSASEYYTGNDQVVDKELMTDYRLSEGDLPSPLETNAGSNEFYYYEGDLLSLAKINTEKKNSAHKMQKKEIVVHVSTQQLHSNSEVTTDILKSETNSSCSINSSNEKRNENTIEPTSWNSVATSRTDITTQEDKSYIEHAAAAAAATHQTIDDVPSLTWTQQSDEMKKLAKTLLKQKKPDGNVSRVELEQITYPIPQSTIKVKEEEFPLDSHSDYSLGSNSKTNDEYDEEISVLQGDNDMNNENVVLSEHTAPARDTFALGDGQERQYTEGQGFVNEPLYTDSETNSDNVMSTESSGKALKSQDDDDEFAPPPRDSKGTENFASSYKEMGLTLVTEVHVTTPKGFKKSTFNMIVDDIPGSEQQDTENNKAFEKAAFEMQCPPELPPWKSLTQKEVLATNDVSTDDATDYEATRVFFPESSLPGLSSEYNTSCASEFEEELFHNKSPGVIASDPSSPKLSSLLGEQQPPWKERYQFYCSADTEVCEFSTVVDDIAKGDTILTEMVASAVVSTDHETHFETAPTSPLQSRLLGFTNEHRAPVVPTYEEVLHNSSQSVTSHHSSPKLLFVRGEQPPWKEQNETSSVETEVCEPPTGDENANGDKLLNEIVASAIAVSADHEIHFETTGVSPLQSRLLRLSNNHTDFRASDIEEELQNKSHSVTYEQTSPKLVFVRGEQPPWKEQNESPLSVEPVCESCTADTNTKGDTMPREILASNVASVDHEALFQTTGVSSIQSGLLHLSSNNHTASHASDFEEGLHNKLHAVASDQSSPKLFFVRGEQPPWKIQNESAFSVETEVGESSTVGDENVKRDKMLSNFVPELVLHPNWFADQHTVGSNHNGSPESPTKSESTLKSIQDSMEKESNTSHRVSSESLENSICEEIDLTFDLVSDSGVVGNVDTSIQSDSCIVFANTKIFSPEMWLENARDMEKEGDVILSTKKAKVDGNVDFDFLSYSESPSKPDDISFTQEIAASPSMTNVDNGVIPFYEKIDHEHTSKAEIYDTYSHNNPSLVEDYILDQTENYSQVSENQEEIREMSVSYPAVNLKYDESPETKKSNDNSEWSPPTIYDLPPDDLSYVRNYFEPSATRINYDIDEHTAKSRKSIDNVVNTQSSSKLVERDDVSELPCDVMNISGESDQMNHSRDTSQSLTKINNSTANLPDNFQYEGFLGSKERENQYTDPFHLEFQTGEDQDSDCDSLTSEISPLVHDQRTSVTGSIVKSLDSKESQPYSQSNSRNVNIKQTGSPSSAPASHDVVISFVPVDQVDFKHISLNNVIRDGVAENLEIGISQKKSTSLHVEIESISKVVPSCLSDTSADTDLAADNNFDTGFASDDNFDGGVGKDHANFATDDYTDEELVNDDDVEQDIVNEGGYEEDLVHEYNYEEDLVNEYDYKEDLVNEYDYKEDLVNEYDYKEDLVLDDVAVENLVAHNDGNDDLIADKYEDEEIVVGVNAIEDFTSEVDADDATGQHPDVDIVVNDNVHVDIIADEDVSGINHLHEVDYIKSSSPRLIEKQVAYSTDDMYGNDVSLIPTEEEKQLVDFVVHSTPISGKSSSPDSRSTVNVSHKSELQSLYSGFEKSTCGLLESPVAMARSPRDHQASPAEITKYEGPTNAIESPLPKQALLFEKEMQYTGPAEITKYEGPTHAIESPLPKQALLFEKEMQYTEPVHDNIQTKVSMVEREHELTFEKSLDDALKSDLSLRKQEQAPKSNNLPYLNTFISQSEQRQSPRSLLSRLNQSKEYSPIAPSIRLSNQFSETEFPMTSRVSSPSFKGRMHDKSPRSASAASDIICDRTAFQEIDELQAAVDEINTTNLKVWQSSLNSLGNLRHYQLTQQEILSELLHDRERAEKECQRLREALDLETSNHQNDVKELEGALRASQADVEKIQEARKELVTIAEEAIATQADLEQKALNLDRELSARIASSVPREDHERIMYDNATLETRIQQFNHLFDAQSANLDEQTSTIVQQKSSIKKYEKETNALKAEQRRSRIERDSLRNELTIAQVSIGTVESLQEELDQINKKADAFASNSRNKVKELYNTIAEKDELITQQERDMITTKSRYSKRQNDMQVELDTCNDLIRSLRVRISELEGDLESSKQALDQANDNLHKSGQSNLKLKQSIEAMELELNAGIAEINNLKRDLHQALTDRKNENKRVARMESALSEFRKETKTRVEKVVQNRNEAAALLEKSLRENAELSQKNHELQMAFNELQEERSAYLISHESERPRYNYGGESSTDAASEAKRPQDYDRNERERKKDAIVPLKQEDREYETRQPLNNSSLSYSPKTMRRLLTRSGSNTSNTDRLLSDRAEEIAAYMAMTAKTTRERRNMEAFEAKQLLYALEDVKDAEITALKARIRLLERRME